MWILLLIVVILLLYVIYTHPRKNTRAGPNHSASTDGSSVASNVASSTCSYLRNLGYFNSPFQNTEKACLKYFQGCGEASNAGLAYTNILQPYGTAPATFNGQQDAEILYENADPSIPGNYCEPTISCPCPSGLPFTCKSFTPNPGQQSPGCF